MTARRAINALVYGAAGLLVDGALAAGIILAGAAAFWLLIFGDDPWPAWAETALAGAGYSAGLTVLLGALYLGWRRSGGGA